MTQQANPATRHSTLSAQAVPFSTFPPCEGAYEGEFIPTPDSSNHNMMAQTTPLPPATSDVSAQTTPVEDYKNDDDPRVLNWEEAGEDIEMERADQQCTADILWERNKDADSWDRACKNAQQELGKFDLEMETVQQQYTYHSPQQKFNHSDYLYEMSSASPLCEMSSASSLPAPHQSYEIGSPSGSSQYPQRTANQSNVLNDQPMTPRRYPASRLCGAVHS